MPRPFLFQNYLRDEFSAATRNRGVTYSESGAVERLRLGPEGAWAWVRGTEYYCAGICWGADDELGVVGIYCACRAFEEYGPCKHIWALVIELDTLGARPAEDLPEEVAVYEYSSDDPTLDPHAEFGWVALEWTPGDPREQANSRVVSTGHRIQPTQAAPPIPHTEDWERTLNRFRLWAPEWKDAWSGVADRTWEIRYVIHSVYAENYGDVHLRVRYHRLLKNGTWSKGSDYVFGGRSQPALDRDDDRDIHASLRGVAYSGYGFTMGSSGYLVDEDSSIRLLPMIASTGRLFLQLPGGVEKGPMLLDEGEPWSLCLEMRTDTEKGEVRVEGEFVRGDERMPVGVPILVLPSGFLFVGNSLARFTPASAGEQINFLRRTKVRAPIEARDQVARMIMGCSGFSPGDLATVREAIVPSFHLFVGAVDGPAHHSRNLPCQVLAVYAGCRIEPFEAGEFLPAGKPGEWIRRDVSAEGSALEAFLANGGKRVGRPEGGPDDCCVVASSLSGLVTGLLKLGWTVEAEGKLWRRAGASSFSVRSGIDWFDLEGGIDFGEGQVASLPALVEAAQAKSTTVQLGDGTLGVLPERWMESWGLLDLAGKPEGDAMRFQKNQGWLLDALLAEREAVTLDKGFRELRERIANFQGIPEKRETKSFQGELRTYQRNGLGWFEFLRSLGINGCLADDMGLGKTIQVLALLESRRLNRRRKGGVDLPTLVVAPRSVVFNWLDEAAKFTPKLRVLGYTGLDRHQRLEEACADRVDLVVTTYGTLRLDIMELREREFDYVVLDEAQAIKNPRSQAAKAARLLQCRHRLALSGTPIENHLGELWSLFEFLNPGMLGASGAFKQFARSAGATEADEDFSRLAKALSPFFLRRTKEEVLPDLPTKTEQVLLCDLKGRERREYDKLRDYYRTSLASRQEEVGLPKMKIQVLEALLRLRQAACHPGLIAKDQRSEESAKLRVLLPMLEEICQEGHKALVFSQFTSLLAIVREHLDDRGLAYEYLDGRTRKRKEKVERFQTDKECPLFLISIKAGGSGLNLTSADYVFLLDPWWNPAVEAQAVDRVHRIGRTKPVIAYRLIASDTVEQKVVKLQESKRRLADAVLGQGSVSLRDMTSADLEFLLS